MGTVGKLLLVSLVVSIAEVLVRLFNHINDIDSYESELEAALVSLIILSWIATLVVYVVS